MSPFALSSSPQFAAINSRATLVPAPGGGYEIVESSPVDVDRGLPPIQVTLGGSAAALSIYVILTALVVYNSKKCSYCDLRLVVCNYLIALCSFRIAIFGLRLAASVMDTWPQVPLSISYVLMAGAIFCLAQAGSQLVFDWHWLGLDLLDVPKAQRLAWAVTRHLLLSIALVLGLFNVLTRNYIPIGYLSAGIFWLISAAIAIGATWIWVRRRRDAPDAVGVGALLFALSFTVAIAAEAVYIFLFALGEYRPLNELHRWPLTEAGVMVLQFAPDLLVLLPAAAFDMADLDAIRPFRFIWHRESAPQPTLQHEHETVELRRRRTPPPPPIRHQA